MPAVGFAIAPEVFGSFPGLRVAVVAARGVKSGAAAPRVDALLDAAWASATSLGLPNPQSHPHVAAWRVAFRAMGVSPREYPSSIEALLRRALKGGEPLRINPLVDLYNAVSLRHIVPVGGFDLGGIGGGDLELRLSREGDRFEPLGGGEEETVAPGEVAYAVDGDVLTRHFVWRQSRQAALHPTTRDALIMSEVLGGIGDEVVAAVLEDLRDGLGQAAHADRVVGAVLEAGAPAFEW